MTTQRTARRMWLGNGLSGEWLCFDSAPRPLARFASRVGDSAQLGVHPGDQVRETMRGSTALGRIAAVVALGIAVRRDRRPAHRRRRRRLRGHRPSSRTPASSSRATRSSSAASRPARSRTIELGDDGQALVTFTVDPEYAPLRARHHGDGPLLLARPASPTARSSSPSPPTRSPARRSPPAAPSPAGDRLRGRPRRGLQHPRPRHRRGLQARHPGLRDRIRRRRQADQQGLSVPQPLPLHLASPVRRAHLRPEGLREPDRRHRPALRRPGRPRPRHLRPGRKPQPDDGRDRLPEGGAGRGGLEAARLPALGQHHLRQPPGRPR